MPARYAKPTSIARAWNDAHPIGTSVRYRTSSRTDGLTSDGRTRSAAAVVEGEACVWIEGVRGPILLVRVEVDGEAT